LQRLGIAEAMKARTRLGDAGYVKAGMEKSFTAAALANNPNVAVGNAIKINDQYRVIFQFRGGNAHDVRIGDYHP